MLVGAASEIRRPAKRRQKNDRRDASLILDLLLKGEFPRVYRPCIESREVLRLLRYRHNLVQTRPPLRTVCKRWPSAPARRGGRGC